MKVVQLAKDEQSVTLEVAATEQEVNRAFEVAEINFCQAMGVRMDPQKTLAQSAAEQMGISNLDMLVNQQAVDALVPMAIDKHGVCPAFMPSIENADLVMRGKPFKFTVNVIVKPEFELASYDPVSISVFPYDGDEATVEQQLHQMLVNRAEFVDVEEDRPLVNGDAAFLSLVCKQDGNEIKPLTTEGRTYVLGSGGMPVTFEQNVIGMKKGETKTFTFEAPRYDGSSDKVEPYEATVGVISIQKEIVPELTDEWVAQNSSDYKTVAELREALTKEVHRVRRAQYDDYVRNVASVELSKRFMGHIPDEVFEGTRTKITNDLRQQVSSQGIRWEEFVSRNGGEEQVERNIFMQTRQSLVQCYALDAIFRTQGLKVTEQDIKDVCEQINPQLPDEARKMMEEQGYGFSLRESAERYCASKWVVEHAQIAYKNPETQEEQAE